MCVYVPWTFCVLGRLRHGLGDGDRDPDAPFDVVLGDLQAERLEDLALELRRLDLDGVGVAPYDDGRPGALVIQCSQLRGVTQKPWMRTMVSGLAGLALMPSFRDRIEQREPGRVTLGAS